MRPSLPIRDVDIAQTIAAVDCGSPLLSGTRLPMTVAGDHLPAIPDAWATVPGSTSGGPTERFTAYTTERGRIVTIHSVLGAAVDPPGRLIALVTLGRHRISVAEAGPDRFDARWQYDGRSHCLATAATTFGAFIGELLGLNWP